jgi:putative SOS response-associated peptidase YedK
VCSNYVPVTDADQLLAFFGVRRDFGSEAPPEVYPAQVAPFIRLANGARTAEAGLFGLLPPWRRELRFGTRTYNARTETVDQLPSYKESWRRGLRCVIPAEAVYEPRYEEDGTCERWRIGRADGTPFGVAGLYNEWSEHGEAKFSFTMLTVNCDGHPFYAQFHAPGQEKRMPVFLDPEEYDAWMSCALREAPRYFRAWPGPFQGGPEPRAPRARKTAAEPPPSPPAKPPKPPKPTAPPKPPPAQGSLF